MHHQPDTQLERRPAALYAHAEADYLAYLEQQVRGLDWFAPWYTVLQWTPPRQAWPGWPAGPAGVQN